MSLFSGTEGNLTLFEAFFFLSVLMAASILEDKGKETELLSSIDSKLDRLVNEVDNKRKIV